MEKEQFGTRVEFQVKQKLFEFKTSKTNIEMFRSTHHGDILMMDNEVQFSTLDEHRYHEILVHPALQHSTCKDVLILGGGDGMAAREVYKWKGVESITIVDYDEEFVSFAKDTLHVLNSRSLHDERTRLVYQDASEFCAQSDKSYDAIFIDLPDPEDELLNVYMNCLYGAVRMLKPGGSITLHCGAVSLDNSAECWRIIRDFATILRTGGLQVDFRSIFVPSFMNQWGFLTGFMQPNLFNPLPEQKLWTSCMPYDSDYESIYSFFDEFKWSSDDD